jgi:RNA polymerase sigma-70 factor (ECF subfamily)
VRHRLKGLSDTELALLAKDGDSSAFEEIYDRHASGIARALASYAGPDRDILDDLTQEVFFRVIDSLVSYVPSHPFPHWLYTIALNVGRNHIRRRSKVVSVDPRELDSISRDQDRIGDWSEEIIEVTLIRLVTHLPDHMREVVSLRIGSGMPYGEIAEVLGIPEGTARSRMHHAVRILREKVGVPISRREIQ